MSHTFIPVNRWLPNVCQIAYDAGQLISQYYHQEEAVGVEKKSDGSPVTEADQAADDFICQALTALTPNIPLVTEESVSKVPFSERQAWSTYWLVDPLDGTKEFIAKTGEYSVNIALIHNHRPVLGVVYGTELGNMYFATQKCDGITQSTVGKFENLMPSKVALEFDWNAMIQDANPISVAKLPLHTANGHAEAFRVAVSRRHGGALDHFMGQLGHATQVQMGSALKTCLVAEGKADIYPRFGPTSLWDTGAAQCILEVAGGAVLNAAGHSLQYVQTESLLNPFFIAVGDANYHWPKFPEII
jgi:3'(2'), 5'-bisphosphate nucleotidase